MREKIIKVCKVILYGKYVLEGYYSAAQRPKNQKKYIFSSVFPSYLSMKKALMQTTNLATELGNESQIKNLST